MSTASWAGACGCPAAARQQAQDGGPDPGPWNRTELQSRLEAWFPHRAGRKTLRISQSSRRSSPQRQEVASASSCAFPTEAEPTASLQAVAERIIACQRCPRLRAHCRQIALTRKRAFADQEYWGRPVPGFGDPGARLLIVGLAPAAHGGNRTGRVFTGDSSGDWLYEALHRFGWANQPVSRSPDDGLLLQDCYVTAAARCAPPDNRPSPAELDRCRTFLSAEIRLLAAVRVVLTLGRIAWESWLRASGWWELLPPAGRPRFGHGEEAVLPNGIVLIASYHPSRQNTNTGKLTREMWYRVFERLRTIVSEFPPPLV